MQKQSTLESGLKAYRLSLLRLSPDGKTKDTERFQLLPEDQMEWIEEMRLSRFSLDTVTFVGSVVGRAEKAIISKVNPVILEKDAMIKDLEKRLFDCSKDNANYIGKIQKLEQTETELWNGFNMACSYLESIKGAVEKNGAYYNEKDFIGTIITDFEKVIEKNKPQY